MLHHTQYHRNCQRYLRFYDPVGEYFVLSHLEYSSRSMKPVSVLKFQLVKMLPDLKIGKQFLTRFLFPGFVKSEI